MAISGSFYGTTSNSAIKPKISWTAEKNEGQNSSQVTATLSYSRTDSYETYGHWAGSLTIHGDTKSVSGKYIEISKNSNTVAITHTVTVPHKDDGTMVVTISATGSISGTTLTKTKISGEAQLESIPRAASIAATDADIGSVSTVTIGKKSDAYTYVVAWEFGSLSGYLTESGLLDTASHVTASSLAFSLPESFYYEIPDRATGSCTLKCTTYLAGTAIGTPQTTTFTVRADPARCGPQLTATVTDTNSATLALTGSKNRFIRYASTATCSLTASARFGATVTQKKIAGKAVTADSLVIQKIETDSVRFALTDSRGYTAEKVVALNMVSYFLPVLRLQAARTDATGGGATLQAEGSFYNGSFGSVKNSLQLQYKLGSGSWVTLQPQLDGNGFSAQQTLEDLDYTKSYPLSVKATDGLHSVTAGTRINPGVPAFDWGSEDFAFHIPVSMDGNRVTELSNPEDTADAVNLGYAQAHFAPVGDYAAKTVTVSRADTNLDDYQEEGTWYFGTDYAPVNPPVGTNGWLRVMRRKASSRILVKQIWFRQGSLDTKSQQTFVRTYDSSYHWSAWSQYITDREAYTVTKLWENASPTASFAAQTISLDLAAYDMVLCLCRLTADTDTVVPPTLAVVDAGYGSYAYGTVTGRFARRTITANASGVTFEDTARYTSYGSTTTTIQNTNLIPVAIYGIKGVA